jgi:hypothetical protein
VGPRRVRTRNFYVFALAYFGSRPFVAPPSFTPRLLELHPITHAPPAGGEDGRRMEAALRWAESPNPPHPVTLLKPKRTRLAVTAPAHPYLAAASSVSAVSPRRSGVLPPVQEGRRRARALVRRARAAPGPPLLRLHWRCRRFARGS